MASVNKQDDIEGQVELDDDVLDEFANCCAASSCLACEDVAELQVSGRETSRAAGAAQLLMAIGALRLDTHEFLMTSG